jgi:putative FmdB family regulatory protein
MPLYEYQCESCGERFEVMQKFADAPVTLHEKCGGSVRRLLSVPALQFKGSGFYINDYAKSGSNSAANGESKKSESGESSKGKESKEGSGTKTESTASPAKSSDSSTTSSTSSSVSDKK